MKKNTIKMKKVLSLFLAVLMVLSAWVWVAPEKAEAALNVTYSATVKFNVTDDLANGGHIKVDYYKFKDDGSGIDDSTSYEYYFSTSLKTDGYSAVANNYSITKNDIPGWPYKLTIVVAKNDWDTDKLVLTNFTIGTNTNVLNNWSGTTQDNQTRTWEYGQTMDNITFNWPVPALSSVRSAPIAQTISVPKTGSASKTFSVSYNDQYGVQWPSTAGTSAALSPVLPGASVSITGNTATVTGDTGVFNNVGYNSTTGQIKTKLEMTMSGVTASCDVTFQAPKYNAYIKNYAGSTVKTYTDIGYYNQSVTLTDIPNNTATAQIAGNDGYHQPYEWPAGIENAFNITGDTTYTEVKGTTEAHSYGDWTKNENDHTRTCSVCGYVQTQDHKVDYSKGYITKEETCTEDGVMTYDCSVCGKKAIETSVINKITGHNFSGTPVENVTGENGNHWIKCSRCDAYGWAGVEDNCEKHNWDKNADGKVNASDATSSKASTCIDAGFETYTCKVCSATWTKTLDLAAHKTIKTAAKDVTSICGDEGNVAFWTCSVCNRVWKDEALTDEVTDKTDADNDGIPDVLETKGPEHSFTGPYVSVSAGENGTHHRQCARFTQCNTYGPEESHTWGTPAVTPATCEKEGKEVYTCTAGCGQTYEKTLDKNPHAMTKIAAVAPECGKPGNNEYYSCSTCNKFYKDEAGTTVTTTEAEKLAALEHKWTAHHDYDEPKSAATCMSAAIYYNHCDYCKAKLTDTHEYGDPDTVNGHKFDGEIRKNADGTHSYKCTVEGCTEYGNATKCNYIVAKDVASTCKTAGYTNYKCKNCNSEYTTAKALDPNNHVGEGTYIIANQAPTCATFGSTGIEKCSGCNAVLSTKINDIPLDPNNHENMIDYDGQEATCQKEGWKAYRYCANCGTYEIKKVTINKKSHKFTKYVTNNDGTHTATCDTCDKAVATPVTDTKDCEGGTANCVDKKVCTVCNSAYGEVDADKHKTVKTIAKVPATCQKEGTEAYRYCEACDKAIEEIKKIEKIEHVYGKWTKVDGEDKHTRSCTTCDKDVAEVATQKEDCNGGIAYCNALAKCAVCKAEYGQLDPLNHSTEANTLKDVEAATCQKEGFSGNYRYDCCDAIKEAGKATEKLQHVFDIEVENSRIDATCKAKGEVTYKCSTCVESEGVEAATEKTELPIDPKNHATPDKTITKGKVDATCESDGYTGDVYYECCYVEGATEADNRKALKSKGSVIKANGQHVYGDAVPEYLIKEIKETKDDEGNVTKREIVLKDEEPTYEEKIAARHADSKWYHAEICTICNYVKYTACYTYAHTYNCVETDTCEVCEGICSLKDAAKHKGELTVVPGKAATCVATGVKEYYTCEYCKVDYLDKAGKTALDKTDENSDGVYDVLVIAKTAHDVDWDSGYVKPEEPEYTYYKCKNCEYEEKVENGYDGSCEHVWSEDYKVVDEADCTNHGYEALYCTLCDEIKAGSYKKISALGHDWDDGKVTKSATCTEKGEVTKTCTRKECGETKTETTDALGHSWNDGVVTKEANCKDKGEILYTCTVCGETKTEETPKNGTHIISGEGIVIKEPTCNTNGSIQYVCGGCNNSFIDIIPATGEHRPVTIPGKEPTCSANGYGESKVCGDCGFVIVEGAEIPADSSLHHDHNGDGYCDDCTYDLLEGKCDCICHKEHWLMKLIYKILNFFWKLFGIGKNCRCGIEHY